MGVILDIFTFSTCVFAALEPTWTISPMRHWLPHESDNMKTRWLLRYMLKGDKDDIACAFLRFMNHLDPEWRRSLTIQLLKALRGLQTVGMSERMKIPRKCWLWLFYTKRPLCFSVPVSKLDVTNSLCMRASEQTLTSQNNVTNTLVSLASKPALVEMD